MASDGFAAIGAGEKSIGAGIALDLICLFSWMISRGVFGGGVWGTEKWKKGMSVYTIRTQTLNSVG